MGGWLVGWNGLGCNGQQVVYVHLLSYLGVLI